MPDAGVMTSLRSLVALWLPLPAFAGCCWLLVTGDLVVQDGVPPVQQDPLFGLATLFIMALCILGGFVSLVLAVVGSASARARPGVTLGSAIWASSVLAAFTLYLAVVTWFEPVYADSSTLGDQVPYQVAAGILALLPLGVAMLQRRRGELPTPVAVGG